MSVCACGRQSDDEDRYCRSCGHNLQARPDDLLVLDGPPDSDEVVGHVQRGGQFWLPIVIVGLVAVAIWGFVSLGASPESELAAPHDEGEEPEPVGPEGEPDEQSAEATTPPTPLDEAPTSTTTPTAPPSSSTDQRASSAPGTPVLGERVDYDLLVSTRGRPAVLDLDLGGVSSHDGGRVYPAAISEPWLILESRTSGGPERLRLDDLGGDPIPIFADHDFMFSSAMPTVGETDPGMMWFSIYRESANGSSFIPALELVDVSSGATVSHPLAAEGVQTIDLFGGRFATGPGGLITGPSGGVYEARADGYRLVVEDGRLIAADRSRALVEVCDAAMRCERAWRDTATWEPLDLRTPDRQAFMTVVVPETDWVMTVRLSNTTEATMLNVASGRTLDLQLPDSDSSLPIPAVSPDGRWLAQVDTGSQSVIFRDLANGDTMQYTFDEPIEPPLFFVAD